MHTLQPLTSLQLSQCSMEHSQETLGELLAGLTDLRSVTLANNTGPAASPA